MEGVTVRALEDNDGVAAVAVINAAAEWYVEFVPGLDAHEPEMTLSEWADEAQRLTWYGAFAGDTLLGVMGLEPGGDAVLFRHAYVLPDYQRQGIASMLLNDLEGRVHGVDRIVVGTYAANYKARQALETAGYQLSADSQSVLRNYYAIPEDRLQTSVTYEKRFDRGE